MIIYGSHLKLFCSIGNGCIENLKEIIDGEYGYDIQPGHMIYYMQYTGARMPGEPYGYSHCIVKSIDENEIQITRLGDPDTAITLKWQQDGKILMAHPCEVLYEKNKLRDILSGKAPVTTEHPSCNFGKGLWYKHGGWRKSSLYEPNLKNFIKLGQMEVRS